MLEFEILSMCDLILHSFGSSFGEEAASVNMVPSVRLRSGGSIGGVDLERVFCGNNQLINLRGVRVQGEEGGEGEVCFEDGTGKQVCQRKIQKVKCAGVEEQWGLVDVYC